MKRKNIKGLIAGAIVLTQLLFGNSAFSFEKNAQAAQDKGNLLKINVQIGDFKYSNYDDSESANGTQNTDSNNTKSNTQTKDDSSKDNNSNITTGAAAVTTSAAVTVNEEANGTSPVVTMKGEAYGTSSGIDLDNIYISENNYSEDMKNIVEPYIDRRKESGYIDGVDNVKLYYEKYACDNPVGNVVICHGFTENLEKYNEMIYYFLNNGYNVFGIEHRGHGRSTPLGIADETQINVNNFNDYVTDFKSFMDEVVEPNTDNKKVFLFAHSMGGGIGAKFLEDDPGYFNASVLSSPMLEINTGKVPEGLALAISKGAVMIGKGGNYAPGQKPYSSKYDLASASTSSANRYTYIYNIKQANKEFQKGGGSYNWLYQCLSKTKEITKKKNASKVDIPVLLFQAGNDSLVRPGGQNNFSKYAKNCTIQKVNGSRHEIYFEKDSIQKPYLYRVLEFYKNNL